MKIKKYLVIFIVSFLCFFPVVNANIMCNDGTMSPSCENCHRGCCSHHGGCSNKSHKELSSDSSYYSESSSKYRETNNTDTTDNGIDDHEIIYATIATGIIGKLVYDSIKTDTNKKRTN